MLDENGFEIPDPNPMEIPVGFKRPESLESMMRRFIRGELSQRMAAQGHETFEEAMDFSIDGEEGLPETPWEVAADQASEMEEMRELEARARALAELNAASASKAGTGGAGATAPAPPGQGGSGSAPGASGAAQQSGQAAGQSTVLDLSSTVRTDKGGADGQAAR